MARARSAAAPDSKNLCRGSRATTWGITVDVSPRYLESRSVPHPTPGNPPRFVFAYRIAITNDSGSSVWLRSRRWEIVDADGDRQEVVGEGVVGEQPRLDPGASFEYESFCPLETSWGTMEGSFFMESAAAERELIEVRIGRFYLVASDG